MIHNIINNISSKIPFKVLYIDIYQTLTRQHFIYIILTICIQLFLHYNCYLFYNKLKKNNCKCGLENNFINYIYNYSIFKLILMIIMIIIYVIIYNKKIYYIKWFDNIIKYILFIDIAFLIYWTYNVYLYYSEIKNINCSCAKIYNIELLYFYSIIIISSITIAILSYLQNILLTKSSEYIDSGLNYIY